MTNPLAAYLTVRGEKANAFAERIGVSPSKLSRLMAGEREADATVLCDIEEATGGKVKPNDWIRWWRAQPRTKSPKSDPECEPDALVVGVVQ